MNPLTHYLCFGEKETRNPNRLFITSWYLECNPDVRDSGASPLIHFIDKGALEGRSPGPDFDSAYYLAKYPDVKAVGVNPLAHYLTTGAQEGRDIGAGMSKLATLKLLLPTKMHRFFEQRDPYDVWVEVNQLTTSATTDLLEALQQRAGRLPTISLITPVYNTPAPLLRDMVNSVLCQLYENWELCLVDDASPSAHIRPLLEELAGSDRRVKVRHLARNGGMSIATNAAVEIATGEIIAFLDHDDLITADCVGELALYYADHPNADIVYSDDDKIDLTGRRFAPQFKPDWAPTLLLSYMYFSHIFSVRRSLFVELDGFRKHFDGAQDFDFALRATERAREVGHIPRVLYHWRVTPGSTAASADAKPESMEAGRRAVEETAARRRLGALRVVHPDWAKAAKVGMFEIEFSDDGPSVSIVIPTLNQLQYIKPCIESLDRTTYRNFTVLVADNDSDDPETLHYLDEVAARRNHRVVRIGNEGGSFNFAALVNKAARHASSEYILLLNNDVEVVEPRWLSQMVGYARMQGVGAVGARLYFADQTIQHAGIVHGLCDGLVGHAFRHAPPHDFGYMGFIRTAREYSAVTAACMLTPRRLFTEVGGFGEKDFAVAYNDVDYGYRLVDAGWRCIYCPTAELFHYEGKSRSKIDHPLEVAALRRRYGRWNDRWYNPNLSLENESFEPAPVRPEIRRSGPVQIVVMSHNLNFEGAPQTLLDLTIALVRSGAVEATVLSPLEGPLREVYEAAGVPVQHRGNSSRRG